MAYREGPPSVGTIAPDRRRARALQLALAGVAAGALLAGTFGYAVRAAAVTTPVAAAADVHLFTKAGAGNVDQDKTERMLSEQARSLRAQCWDTAAMKDEPAVVTMTLTLYVGDDGYMKRAEALDGNSTRVRTCVAHEASHWKIPAPGGPVTLNVPLHFAR